LLTSLREAKSWHWERWVATGADEADRFVFGSIEVGGRLPSALLCSIEDGDTIIADVFGAAYGVATTVEEAFSRWSDAARELRDELMAEEDHLHPRMAETLLFLRRIFG
jgi:hypothetical protein